ncbi:MAG: sulfatase [Rikenellaceae bacterium]
MSKYLNQTTFTTTLLALGGLCCASTATAKSEKQPNILIILADDYGWNDLGCMGSQFYETPNLDRLAAKGVRFTCGYSACSVSSPSRASIMTGKSTPRHGITSWIGDPAGEEWRKKKLHSKLLPAPYALGLKDEEVTLPEYLRDNGYTTFIAGKWHLGRGETSTPEDNGFEVNVGAWEAGGPKGGYFAPYQNPKLKDGEDGEQLSMRLAQETAKFMEGQQKNGKKPFFAYLSFYAVHGNIETSKSRWEYFRDKANKTGVAPSGFVVDRTLPVRTQQDNPVYAGLIADMDSAIGHVLDELERLKIDKNTLVFFVSDNGGVVSGDSYSTCLAPLRGGKGRQWEGGTRTPFIVYDPNSEGGRTCDTPTIGMDLYPTILSYAGLKPLPEQHVDGVDIMPLVRGGEIASRNLYWHYPHYGNQGGEPSSIVRSGAWKLIYYWEDGRLELYNLDIDLGESETLNHLYPERVETLRADLMAWLKDTGAVAPKADPTYDPKLEHATKLKMQSRILNSQESLRKKMLSPTWQPNASWWGSLPVTVD